MAISLPPALLHRIAQAIRTPTALAFARAARRPRAHQERLLLDLLKTNASTVFGEQHDFASIEDFDTFRRRVPLMDPETLQTWVKRLQSGERNLISIEPPIFYARSTGTTGTPKEVPITESYRADFQRSMLAGMWYSYWSTPQAFRGKLLYFVSKRCVSRSEDGVEVGYISGYNFTEMPPLVASIYAWPYEVFLIDDLPTRHYLMLHIAIMEDTNLIAGIFPFGVVEMMRALETRIEELAGHFDAGTFPDWLKLDDAERAFFERYRRDDKTIARRLRDAASKPRGELVPAVWPNLEAVFCWVTSTAGLFIPELREHLGPDILIRDTIYSASEGWCSIPMGEEEPGGALAITSHIYEFIEEDAYETVDGDITRLDPEATLLPDELEQGKRYYIVLTTSAGLYRYCLGDLVEVCGMWQQLPRIKFVRKLGAYSSLVGEKLQEPHVNLAVAAALEAHELQATWFTLIPRQDVAGYELFIEFSGRQPTPRERDAFANAVDGSLARQAWEYGDNQKKGALAPLRLLIVDPGCYQRHCQWITDQGGSTGQLKMSHLVTDHERLPNGAREAIEHTVDSTWFATQSGEEE